MLRRHSDGDDKFLAREEDDEENAGPLRGLKKQG
jgi:hypothetical protein